MEPQREEDFENYTENDYIRDDIRDILLACGFQRSFIEVSIARMGDNPSIFELCYLLDEYDSFEKFINRSIMTEKAIKLLFKQEAHEGDIRSWIKNYIYCQIFDFEERGFDLEETTWGSGPGLKSKYKKELSISDFKLLKEAKKKLNMSWVDVGKILLSEKPDNYIKEMHTYLGYCGY